MNKKIKRRIFGYAAAACMVFVFSTSAYGQEIFQVVKNISLGKFSHYTQEEYVGGLPEHAPLPKELEGKLFDQAGNVISQPPADGKFYNESGQRVFVEQADGRDGYVILTKEQKKQQDKNIVTAFYTLEEARPYFAGRFSTPSYLPEGYRFDRAEVYNNEKGQAEKDSFYLNIYYSNDQGKEEITTMLRVLNEETEIASGGTEYVEELTIGKHKAVRMGNGLDIEIDGILYSLYANDDVSKEEIVLMAESLN